MRRNNVRNIYVSDDEPFVLTIRLTNGELLFVTSEGDESNAVRVRGSSQMQVSPWDVNDVTLNVLPQGHHYERYSSDLRSTVEARTMTKNEEVRS